MPGSTFEVTPPRIISDFYDSELIHKGAWSRDTFDRAVDTAFGSSPKAELRKDTKLSADGETYQLVEMAKGTPITLLHLKYGPDLEVLQFRANVPLTVSAPGFSMDYKPEQEYNYPEFDVPWEAMGKVTTQNGVSGAIS